MPLLEEPQLEAELAARQDVPEKLNKPEEPRVSLETIFEQSFGGVVNLAAIRGLSENASISAEDAALFSNFLEEIARELTETRAAEMAARTAEVEALEAGITASKESRRERIEAEKRAITDSLTGLYNRRFFEERLTSLKNKFERNLAGFPQKRATDKAKKTAFSLIMIDIDNFKAINDNYGHPAGDDVLANLGRLLKEKLSIRKPLDTIARYGGEELVILLDDTTIEEAEAVAERLRQLIAEHAITDKDGKTINNEEGQALKHITASIGVAQYNPQEMDNEGGLKLAADEALYHAKKHGRNQVSSWRNLQ
ncbi:MAG: hypothetical protein A2788_00125 [Candidatus Abawacabacteria bacterium RIFCSPHIGHO2_01_FULL_46_8]|uniref:GGDEF domain-containing protein n=1 Tax=Candidatus Abawacabacteria bacterium RIFCSPHIGHO2_01_FULL_46_8 TaxID=1817815 RepID=A0A1F4XLW4_9BACT|nr:MAG: hypothetical protein A2788_00125 [Candidatus Abawacabacteria bacterium RIFCSPHIGHO2_01_FULL_46_8]